MAISVIMKGKIELCQRTANMAISVIMKESVPIYQYTFSFLSGVANISNSPWRNSDFFQAIPAKRIVNSFIVTKLPIGT